MNAIDELSKLGELKKNGLVTDEEFDNQKAAILGNQSKKKGNLWWRIPVGIVSAILLIFTIFGARNNGVKDELPLCASKDAVEVLKQAFDNSPGAQTYHYIAVDVSEMKEIENNKQSHNRKCSGKLLLNNAVVFPIKYTLQQKQDGGYLLTYEANMASTEINPVIKPSQH